jgi:hypothetical protein
MEISATVVNQDGRHQSMVRTEDKAQSLAIPAKFTARQQFNQPVGRSVCHKQIAQNCRQSMRIIKSIARHNRYLRIHYMSWKALRLHRRIEIGTHQLGQQDKTNIAIFHGSNQSGHARPLFLSSNGSLLRKLGRGSSLIEPNR